MKHLFRQLSLFGAIAISSMAFAQPAPPYPVTVTGQVVPCTGNTSVNLTTVQNTMPTVDIDVPLDANCSYSATLMMDDPQGWFQVSAACSGAMQSVTGSYQVNAFDSVLVVMDDITCGGGPGGSCQANFSVQQSLSGNVPIPWQISTTNLSTGSGTLSYEWWMPDGSSSTDAEPTYTFSQPGVYGICLTIASSNCTSTFCDTIAVDTAGFISTQPIWYDCQGVLWGPSTVGTPCDDGNPITTNDTWSANCTCVGQGGGQPDCLGIPNGPNLPGTACSDSTGGGNITGTWDNNCICQPDSSSATDCLGIPGGPNLPGTPCTTAIGDPGTWSAACVCVEDSSSTNCNADFWPIQAYDSTATGTEPIPNEVWVWNLSSGGNGNYQFTWDFGDGSTSTEAYPTHVYNSDGPWLLCLTMTSANCTDTYCDSISVDANGILNQLVIDGNGAADHELNSGARSGGFTLNVIQQIPTGINEIPAFAELKAWPNPVLNELNLTFNSSMSGTVPVTVIDPSGRAVLTESPQLTTGSNTFRISTSTLEPGLYMVRIGNDARSITQRFMKVR